MTRRPAIFLGLLLCLAATLLATYLYQHLQPYQAVIEHGPAPEARDAPYLAAEQFLRQQGLMVERADGLDMLAHLQPERSSLLLLGERHKMTHSQVEDLLQWVEDGGRLLFVAEALWDETSGNSGDLLLDRLQLRQYMSADLPGQSDPLQTYPRLTRLYLANELTPAYFSFDPDYHLEDPGKKAHTQAGSGVATHLLQLSRGRGQITVVTDSELWQNPAIGRYDNAWLLWYLNRDRAVTLVERPEHANLATLLWRHFPQALAALALLLALWVWRLAMRHGPIQPPAPRARRQLQEHLLASADFQLRHGGQHRLVQALQEDILRRARHRHPGFERLATAEQRHILALLTQHVADDIDQALRLPSGRRLSSTEFSQQVAYLQALRNAL